MAASVAPEGPSESLFAKFSKPISTVFTAAYKRLIGPYQNHIRCGRTPFDMPAHLIIPLLPPVTAATTGPYGGICQLLPDKDHPTHPPDERIAGVVGWRRPHVNADGESITLYEHKDGTTYHHGDPIADVYAVLARPNSCVLAVADGCGWGIKPRLAARCAVHGSLEHLNEKLFGSKSTERFTTQDIFHVMYRSLHSAQKTILKHGGTTTTLCLAVVIELAEPKAGNHWGVCVVSVGDSICYVWRHASQEVHEVTAAIRDGKERNLRDAGGCLGADMGDHPDLTNLFCCFAPVAEDDLVFLSSDGISDNFDPVTLREAVAESTDVLSTNPLTPSPALQQPRSPSHHSSSSSSSSSSAPASSFLFQLPALSPAERHHQSLSRMSTILKEVCAASPDNTLNAVDTKDALRNHVIEVTEEKRQFLEQVWAAANNATLTPSERREQDKKIGQTVKKLPGKLDHATVAVFKVGRLGLGGGGGGGESVDHHNIPRRPHTTTQSYPNPGTEKTNRLLVKSYSTMEEPIHNNRPGPTHAET